jgi:hypothetical protein
LAKLEKGGLEELDMVREKFCENGSSPFEDVFVRAKPSGGESVLTDTWHTCPNDEDDG